MNCKAENECNVVFERIPHGDGSLAVAVACKDIRPGDFLYAWYGSLYYAELLAKLHLRNLPVIPGISAILHRNVEVSVHSALNPLPDRSGLSCIKKRMWPILSIKICL
jgi:hypothetical protein